MAGTPPADDRLDSWKEIATYLRRDITTVQRWEKRERMPVHRHLHDKLGSVYAFRQELDEWSRSRKPGSSPTEVQPEVTGRGAILLGRRRWRLGLIVGSLAAVAGLTLSAWLQQGRDASLPNLIASAEFQRLDFDGTERAAALSRDGRVLAFLSDRDGQTDVWVTQLGTGRFYNLTRGRFPALVNPVVRTVSFSPDGALVTFWARDAASRPDGNISVWAVPVLGGEPTRYLDGAAEFDWSSDGSRLVYHTPGPGDPMFVRDRRRGPEDRRVFNAPPGVHAHFLSWPPAQPFIYFVQGVVPDAMDIWRIPQDGGDAERITHHNSRVTYPVLLDGRNVLYLATSSDGAGPWLHAVDVERREPLRLRSGVETYTSLAASADGRRLALTLASPRHSLWRLPISDRPVKESALIRIPLTTGRSVLPRMGPGYLLYISTTSAGDSVWKLAEGAATEVWNVAGARVIGTPALAPDGQRVAFSIEQEGKRSLLVLHADGTRALVVSDSLDLRGAPAWAPDGRSITTAANDGGTPRLFAVPLDGAPPVRLGRDYGVDPVWSPDGRFMLYSGPDVGTTFPVKAIAPDGKPYPLQPVVLTRGATRLRFLPGSRSVVLMRGEIEHKDLWAVDLESGAERQLTAVPRDFSIQDFDISPDGREIILHRLQEQSDLVLLDVPRR